MPAGQPDSAQRYLPKKRTLPALIAASKGCEGCHLYQYATQTVFGEGPANARVVMVGEQPGDAEDLEGRPFVGPAGKLLDKALEEAGIDRSQVYVTNAVKHFKFEERGKRRIHKKPGTGEINACKPWLAAEISAIKPDVLVILGATAAQSIMGKDFRIARDRGKFLEHSSAKYVYATVHPSALLRIPDVDERHAEYARFVSELHEIGQKVSALS